MKNVIHEIDHLAKHVAVFYGVVGGIIVVNLLFIILFMIKSRMEYQLKKQFQIKVYELLISLIKTKFKDSKCELNSSTRLSDSSPSQSKLP